MSQNAAAAPKTWCFACNQKVEVDAQGKPLKHDKKNGSRCLDSAPTEPAASMIGWGLGLVLIAALPFVIGLGSMISSPYADGGVGWLVFAGIIQTAGVIMLCIGIHRLARKADAAFLMSHERHETARAESISRQEP